MCDYPLCQSMKEQRLEKRKFFLEPVVYLDDEVV